MSVTAAQGFRAAGVAAGLTARGGPDVALVINDGPGDAAAAVFGTGQAPANPVLWSERTIMDGRLRAVVLNSGGANGDTGPEGFQLTHATAEQLAELAGISAFDVLVGSTGPTATMPSRERLLAGVVAAHAELRADGGDDAALALSTGPVPRQAAHVSPAGWIIGGLAEAAGELMVLTTDADVEPAGLDAALRLGVPSAHRTVALLASAASGVRPDPAEFAEAVRQVCLDLGARSVDTKGADQQNSAHAR